MSDLMVGVGGGMGQPSVSHHQNGVHPRGTGPSTTSNLAAAQSVPASGVRTPRDVLRQREARKKEQEAAAKEQQLQQRKQQEQEHHQQQQQSQHAAGVAGESSSQRRPGASLSRPPDMPLPQDPGLRQHARGGSLPVGAQQTATQTTQSTRQRPSTSAGPSQPQGAGSAQPEAQTQGGETSQPQTQPKRPSFPHAFERWEMLSSHWEGLTGYWIRRLEQNKEELSRDPLSQQMSRQITDLSAAGANLFHAVVELQRLRASSERKFQRWFFDTRAEQERNQELRAELERQLKAERQARIEALAAARKAESDKMKAEELVREMRRELQISKEEARRAWEELGRREQEERERTAALRNGEPTIVGGVQVVPMVPNMSRQTSTAHRPPTREGPYSGGPGPMRMGGQQPTESEEQYMYEHEAETPTATRQFVQTTRGQDDPFVVGKEPATTAPSSAAAQQQQVEASDAGTEGMYSSNRRDNRTAYPPSISDDSDDYQNDDHYDDYGRRHHPHPYGTVQYGAGQHVTGAEEVHMGFGQGVDYSGSDWGVWDSITPRHRHPTRLSDVIEEDERSRTSASRASQASRVV
ncbi:hypothetical protein VTO42DRAFT_485 [Malbranchea cinnamomea]